MPYGMSAYHSAVWPGFQGVSDLLHSANSAAHCKLHSWTDLPIGGPVMSRHPLTVYLEREQLVAVERQARLAGIPKSAWAGQILDRALSGQGATSDRVFEQIIKIRATLDAFVATQPQKDELRKRIDVKVQRYTAEAQGSLAL